MLKNTTTGTIFQSVMGVPFVMVRLAFWLLSLAIRGTRAAARWIIRAAEYAEGHMDAWEDQAEQAVTAATVAAIRAACCLAGCLVEQIAAAWRFREGIILEGRAAA